MQKFILLLILVVGMANSASSQYIDPNFSIKDFKVFVQVIDKAKEGCWTNISETRKYIKNKLSESGAKLIDDQSKTDLTLKFLYPRAKNWARLVLRKHELKVDCKCHAR